MGKVHSERDSPQKREVKETVHTDAFILLLSDVSRDFRDMYMCEMSDTYFYQTSDIFATSPHELGHTLQWRFGHISEYARIIPRVFLRIG